MSSNLEAIAIKNLQGILREKGYSAESLFSKYDLDGDGTLSKSEFEGALRAITGQVAPNAIVQAVFGALDQDSDGAIKLEEMLAEMKEVYLSDGNFDKYEQSIYNMLKKIMKK